MAKDWALKFYGSRSWKSLRRAFKASKNGLCERCLKRGEYVPGGIVHHKTWLTQTNINDSSISLNWDLLELLCHECHNAEHEPHTFKQKEPYMRDGFSFDEEGNLTYAEQ